MKIVFEKNICSNFILSLSKEWIQINSLGSYSSSTICGLNSRPYHGLYVVPYHSAEDRIILLSKFEEAVFFENRLYELSTNRFKGGIYPDGYKNLKQFIMDPFPKFIYEIEHRRIEKSILLLHDKNILIIRYANKTMGSPVKLVIKPILAARRITEATKEATKINTDSYLDQNVVRLAPRPDLPQLNIYYKRGDYTPAPLWYHNYEYEKDSFNKDEPHSTINEDLFNPGFFSIFLKPYETFDLYISIDKVTDFEYEALLRKEIEFRKQIPNKFTNFPSTLREVAKNIEINFFKDNNAPSPLFTNFPYHEKSTREMLIMLFGLFLFEQNKAPIQKIIETMTAHLRDGLLPVNYPFDGKNIRYQFADLSLILINFGYYFYKKIHDTNYLEQKLYDPFKSIIASYQKGTRFNIYQDKQGLLFTGDRKTSTSWMPLTNLEGDVLRYGKMIEMNALWYNALKILEFFSKELKKTRAAKKYGKMATKTKDAILYTFWNESKSSFYDFIRDDFKDDKFRINQVLSLSLPFSFLDADKAKSVLKRINSELLTDFGLRSLSKKDKDYIGNFEYQINRTHHAYYNGCIWPWTIGLYVDSVLNFSDKTKLKIENINKIFKEFKRLYYKIGLGYIPEILEGEAPNRKNGLLLYGPNLTEFLRANLKVQMLKKAH